MAALQLARREYLAFYMQRKFAGPAVFCGAGIFIVRLRLPFRCYPQRD